MAITVSKVEVWSATISDQAGALDQILRTLADAGDNLECVVGRRQPDQPGQGHVYMTPIKGKKAQAAARAAGLQPASNIANLRIESPNKAGTGHKIMAAIAQAGINVRGISMIGSGNKSIAYVGFDSGADADRAAVAIKALNKKARALTLMSLSHIYELTVPASAIDVNGHVNNVAFVQWMQDAAIAHADAVGCSAATRNLNATWVVRSHEIQYRLPAFLGDILHVRTWIVDCRLVSSRRRYEFIRPSDQALLARGQTDWVLLDLTTLHPIPIPQEIQNLYNPPPSG